MNLNQINKGCSEYLSYISDTIYELLKKNKLVGLLGGDHSVTYGYLSALSKENKNFGVLHIDAHLDLRNSYQGFDYSHASVMRNASKFQNISHFTSIGIRDYCSEEVAFIESQTNRFSVFYDRDISTQLFNGKSWHDLCKAILDTLPQTIYI